MYVLLLPAVVACGEAAWCDRHRQKENQWRGFLGLTWDAASGRPNTCSGSPLGPALDLAICFRAETQTVRRAQPDFHLVDVATSWMNDLLLRVGRAEVDNAARKCSPWGPTGIIMSPLSSGTGATCGQTRCAVDQLIRFAPASSSSQTLGKFKPQD